MKTIAQIAAELQGYDPQALHADQVNALKPWAVCWRRM